jgi:hypothetical protein
MRVSKVFALVAAAVLASCIQVNVVGTHRGAISRDDTAQIRRLVLQRRDLPCDVLTIRPLSADTAKIESSEQYAGSQTFMVRKTHGEWKFDHAAIR